LILPPSLVLPAAAVLLPETCAVEAVRLAALASVALAPLAPLAPEAPALAEEAASLALRVWPPVVVAWAVVPVEVARDPVGT